MKNILFCLALGIVLCICPTYVSALTVSPARLEITADPGQVYSGEVEIFNEQDSDKQFFTSYENFEPQGDSGAPYFIGADDGLATWIKTVDQVVVKAGERAVVPYSITVPADALPGGYFSAIFFGTQPQGTNAGGEVTIGGKIGILVLFRVSGDVEESGGLQELKAKGGARFFDAVPLTFEYRFGNTGGDRVVPIGELKIKNTFRINSATLLANKSKGSVLPNSSRRFEIIWGANGTETGNGFFSKLKRQWKDFHFGWYTADLNLNYGLSNQTAKGHYSFFIIPWQLLLAVLVLLAILIVVGRLILKSYNSYIIKKFGVQVKNVAKEDVKPRIKTKLK